MTPRTRLPAGAGCRQRRFPLQFPPFRIPPSRLRRPQEGVIPPFKNDSLKGGNRRGPRRGGKHGGPARSGGPFPTSYKLPVRPPPKGLPAPALCLQPQEYALPWTARPAHSRGRLQALTRARSLASRKPPRLRRQCSPPSLWGARRAGYGARGYGGHSAPEPRHAPTGLFSPSILAPPQGRRCYDPPAGWTPLRYGRKLPTLRAPPLAGVDFVPLRDSPVCCMAASAALLGACPPTHRAPTPVPGYLCHQNGLLSRLT